MTRMMRCGAMVAVVCAAAGSRAQAASVHAAPPVCSGTIQPTEARVWTGTNFTGTCYSLKLDSSGDSWTSWNATSGFPNDSIQSARTGTGASLVLFWNDFYTKDNGSPFPLNPNTAFADLGSWDRQASAARVQTFAPYSCNASSGETLALFTDQNLAGDCTELSVAGMHCYYDAFDMGFRNDTLTSVFTSSQTVTSEIYSEHGFTGYAITVPPGPPIYNLGDPRYNINDAVSSVGAPQQSCR